MTLEQIYNALNFNWWALNGIYLQTPLYFITQASIYSSYMSTGVPIQGTVTIYLKDYLMYESARQLKNGGCIGGITNIQPPQFKAYPVYFK
jgi:hypothetical protein